jgi:hypothetical protein
MLLEEVAKAIRRCDLKLAECAVYSIRENEKKDLNMLYPVFRDISFRCFRRLNNWGYWVISRVQAITDARFEALKQIISDNCTATAKEIAEILVAEAYFCPYYYFLSLRLRFNMDRKKIQEMLSN